MFQNKNIYLGIAPIGWTNDDMPELGGDISFEQCFSDIAQAGFTGTEVGGKFPENPVELMQACNKFEINIVSQWFSSYLCEKTYEENELEFVKLLDFLEIVQAKHVNVCELTRCLFATQDSMFGNAKPIATKYEWDLLCNGLNKLGKIAKSRGIKLCYHHHMATIVQTVEETRYLLERTNPEYVYLCFDTGHFTFSGEDALKATKEFVSRIGHVHLKDIRKEKMIQAKQEGFWFRKAVCEGCFTVPGDGCIDFASIIKVLAESDYQGWMLVEAEQDPNKANPLQYAKMAREYIGKLTGL